MNRHFSTTLVQVPLEPRPAHDERQGLHLDPDLRAATVDGAALDLTFIEFELLMFLTASPRRVFTRAQLLDAVWGYPDDAGRRTVDVHVARLRRKLGPGHRDWIVTVRRVGYKYQP